MDNQDKFFINLEVVLGKHTTGFGQGGENCIFWEGGSTKSGYGRFRIKIEGKNKDFYSHRAAFMLHNRYQTIEQYNNTGQKI